MGMIFIEGLPCAGKSELIKTLKGNGESVCDELGKLLRREEFPGNGKTLKQIEEIDRWFINKEEWRMSDLSKKFFDRSYFTHICYAYAYSHWISLPSFKPTVNRYQERVLNGGLSVPEYVIYIDVSSQESIDRQLNKIITGISKGLPDFWRDKSFLENTRLAYEKLWQSLLNIPVCMPH
jgi:thymidylate kinase